MDIHSFGSDIKNAGHFFIHFFYIKFRNLYICVLNNILDTICHSTLTLTPACGHWRHTSAQFLICDSLEVLWAFRKAVATPWQQKPLIVSHTGIVAVNVTMPLSQSQRVREHIPAFYMKTRARGARLTCTCAGDKPRAQTFCWRNSTSSTRIFTIMLILLALAKAMAKMK